MAQRHRAPRLPLAWPPPQILMLGSGTFPGAGWRCEHKNVWGPRVHDANAEKTGQTLTSSPTSHLSPTRSHPAHGACMSRSTLVRASPFARRMLSGKAEQQATVKVSCPHWASDASERRTSKVRRAILTVTNPKSSDAFPLCMASGKFVTAGVISLAHVSTLGSCPSSLGLQG